MNAPQAALRLRARARETWAFATYGAERPLRFVLLLTAAGLVSGLGETAIVVLLIALAAGGSLSLGALTDVVPTGTATLAGLALAAVLLVAAGHWTTARASSRASADVRRRVQARLVEAWFGAPWAVQVTVPPAELQHLAGVDVMGVAMGARSASQAFTAMLHVAVVLIAAAAIGPFTVLALACALAAILAIGRPVRLARRRLTVIAQAAQRDLAKRIGELGGLTREVRVFGVSARAQRQLSAAILESAEHARRSEFAGQVGTPLIRDATVALIIVVLAIVQEATDVTLSGLGATVLLLLRALTYAQSLADTGVQLQQRSVQRDRIEAALAAWQPQGAPGTQPAPTSPTIVLDAVSYRHPGAARPAVVDISLELRPGELVGVIGPTGAGKSTLAALLLGLHAPTRGRVMIGGVDLRDIDPHTWHARTAWVGQDPRLLAGTVAENIRLFRTELGDDAVVRAALDAGLGPELRTWAGGIEHAIGPAGATLSVGQRQRVAIARALVGRPSVLVLDEPTSALDVHAEATIRDLLATLRGHALVVVIAHRLSTLRACDRIAVIENGRLTRLAPPLELRRDEAYFRTVLELSRAEPLQPAGPSHPSG